MLSILSRNLFSLLICWLQLSFLSTPGALVLPYTVSFPATAVGKMAIPEIKLVVPGDLFPPFSLLLMPCWDPLSASPDTRNRLVV